MRPGDGGGAGRGALDGLRAGVAVALLALAGLTATAMWGRSPAGDMALLMLAGLCALVALVAIAVTGWLAAFHRRDLDRLRAALLGAGDSDEPFGRRAARMVDDAALRRLADALDQVVAGRDADLRRAERRLAAVVASSPAALLVVTDSGLVSLVNGAARALFPEETIRPGTSVYAALARDDLIAAGERARTAGRTVRVPLRAIEGGSLQAGVAALGDHGGLVLAFEGAPAETGAGLSHDLALHDEPPAAPAAGPDTPLVALPVLALDCETTGLDVAADRMVSLGAVRGHGGRIYAARHLDMLVDPGGPIPAASTAVHGIGDAMVAGAPDAAEALGRLGRLGAGCVAVGHNIGFDLAICRAEAQRAGLDWAPPPALDTAHLVSALEPELQLLDLEAIAERFGVAAEGRHTALGDALVAAELFGRLVPVLADRGVVTLADAWRFARRARGLVAQQRAAGWIVPGDDHER